MSDDYYSWIDKKTQKDRKIEKDKDREMKEDVVEFPGELEEEKRDDGIEVEESTASTTIIRKIMGDWK